MVFDVIPLTHFMVETRGLKTGKKDDGCGNQVGELLNDTSIFRNVNESVFNHG